MLELKNIKKSFGGTEVLKNVGLSVAKGDVVREDNAPQNCQLSGNR